MRVRGGWTAALAGGLVAALALTGPASAGWQYTQWGMSPAEVQAASEGAAVANQDRSLDAADLKAVLVAPYQGATLPFTAAFLFGIRDRLAVVTLSPKDHATCARIPDILRAHYGPPVPSGGDPAKAAHWNDFGNNNLVNFLDLGGGNCSIEYSRLPNPRNDGTL